MANSNQSSFPRYLGNNGQLADFNTVFNNRVVPPTLGAQQYIDGHNIGYPENIGNELGGGGGSCCGQITTKEVFISSEQRNWDTDTPSNYVIDLNDILQNVTRIELVGGNIPASGYTMSSNNNTIYFQETNGTTLTAVVDEGLYTASTLATALKTAMETVGGSTYTITVNTTTSKITIASDGGGGGGIFNLIFRNGTENVSASRRRGKYQDDSIGPSIGFSANDLSGALTYTGDYRLSVGQPDYLAIHLECRGTKLNKITSPLVGVRDAFAIIWLDQSDQTYKVSSPQVTDNGNFYFDFNPPLGKLDQMSVQFRLADNSFYDFNGINNNLLFEVGTALGKEKIQFAYQRR